jgi:hypothetical protein
MGGRVGMEFLVRCMGKLYLLAGIEGKEDVERSGRHNWEGTDRAATCGFVS